MWVNHSQAFTVPNILNDTVLEHGGFTVSGSADDINMAFAFSFGEAY